MPDCNTFESLRDELIEYCGTFGVVTFCCCGDDNPQEGYVMEVGLDFLRLSGPVNFITNFYIPLNRIVTFRALSEPAPTATPVNCASIRTLRQALNEDLCGDLTVIVYCRCNAPVEEAGFLNEIGTNFLEIRLEGTDPDDVHGTAYEDLVVNLCNLCEVIGPIVP